LLEVEGKKRRAAYECLQCRPTILSDPDTPWLPCYAHSNLTGTQHAQFEANLRKKLASKAIEEAAAGYASTLQNAAEQEEKKRKWCEAEEKREEERDRAFKAYCRAKCLVWPNMKNCAKCLDIPIYAKDAKNTT